MILSGIKAVALAQNPVLNILEVIVGKWGLKEEDYTVIDFYKNVSDNVEVINTVIK